MRKVLEPGAPESHLQGLSAGISQAGRWEKKHPGGRASQHAKPGGGKEHQAMGD